MIKRIKQNITPLNICLLILIFIQVIFVIYTNLFKIPDTVDNDSAKVFIHAVEMWKNKTIFLDSWINMTTLEIDCSAIFAMPLYAVTKNMYTAFGLSNIIFAALYVYLFYGICKELSDDITVFYVTALLALIPFSFGQLLYYNMMFFAAGQYVVKAIIPVMTIWLMCKADVAHVAEWAAVAVLCSFFTLISGISSGFYVFVSAIIPVCFCYFLFVMLEKKYIKEMVFCKRTVFLIIQCVLSLGGIYISLKKHVNTRGNSMKYVISDNLYQSFLGFINAFFELYGGTRHVSGTVISVDGIITFARFVLSFVFLAVIVVKTIEFVKIIIKQKSLNREWSVSSYVVTVFLCNFFIHGLTVGGTSLRNNEYGTIFPYCWFNVQISN